MDFVEYKETGMAVCLTCFEKYGKCTYSYLKHRLVYRKFFLEVLEIGNVFSKQANFRFAFIRPSNFSVTNKRYLKKIDKISIILDLSCVDYHELLNKV